MVAHVPPTPPPNPVSDYRLGAGCFDEAIGADRCPREPYEEVISALEGHDLGELSNRVQIEADAIGLTFGRDRPIKVDPVPRVIAAAEWRALEAGLMQRARALNAFLADAYGDQRIFKTGALPRHLLESAAGYEPQMRGLLEDSSPAATIIGFDLVRDASGKLRVLEDNLRMPSGASYALALRSVVAPVLSASVTPRHLDGYVTALGEALHGASSHQGGETSIAIVSDGPERGTWFEHRRLGAALGAPVLTPKQLESTRGRLFARLGRDRRQLDVIYRRLDLDRLSDRAGELTPLGELLVPALRSGRLRCVNAFGTGLADDKLAHAYVEQMIAFYLGEEPTVRSVPAFDLTDERAGGDAIERLGELVVKPRDGFGGHGVTIMPRASEAQRRRVLGAVRRRPEHFVAQEVIPLSTHPTVCEGRLRPRHVDLRPFVISTRTGAFTMPGGLTRYAPQAGEMIVNSSRGGGCKDTWVLAGGEDRR